MTDRRRSVTRRAILGLAGVAAAAGCATGRPHPPEIPVPPKPLQVQTEMGFDRQGNEVLAGSFVGQRRIGGVALTSAGATDVFIAKNGPNGAPVFPPIQIGGPGEDVATALAIDDDGSIVVGGTFQGEITYGAQKQRLQAAVRFPDQRALFVARVNPAGTLEWVKQYAIANLPVQVSVSIRPDHNIVIGASGFGAIISQEGPRQLRGESFTLQVLSTKGDATTAPQTRALKVESAMLQFGCSHSPCKEGAALVSGCGDYGCVAYICSFDSFCCNNQWDGWCVAEVANCARRCDCSQVTTTGWPFYPDASPCVSAIGGEQPYCVDTNWSSLCVAMTALPINHTACTPLCQ
jgi:hypothetical protein